MTGAPGTLYANETYQLQVEFPVNYPMEAPQACHLNPPLWFGFLVLFLLSFVVIANLVGSILASFFLSTASYMFMSRFSLVMDISQLN